MHSIALEKYHGSATRHTCPACGRARKFTRYIDSATGHYIADHVGRCDRESSCGYHYTPKQYFAETPGSQDWRSLNSRKPKKSLYSLRRVAARAVQANTPNFIDARYLLDTLDATQYQTNAFVQFLLGLFPHDAEDVWKAIRDYLIGTYHDPNGSYTCFPYVDEKKRFCKGKLIRFDPQTGHRDKDDYGTSSIVTKLSLKSPGADFNYSQIFFGEHLLATNPGLPVAIVESEKSAIMGSICKGVFPDMVWLACGSGSWLNAERLSRIGRGRRSLLFPDADKDGHWFGKWRGIVSEARKTGVSVQVSDLLENLATDAEKAKGFDLADYLIREQAQRNDPYIREQFKTIIEERLAIMTIDGGTSEEWAEECLITSGLYQSALQTVLG